MTTEYSESSITAAGRYIEKSHTNWGHLKRDLIFINWVLQGIYKDMPLFEYFGIKTKLCYQENHTNWGPANQGTTVVNNILPDRQEMTVLKKKKTKKTIQLFDFFEY